MKDLNKKLAKSLEKTEKFLQPTSDVHKSLSSFLETLKILHEYIEEKFHYAKTLPTFIKPVRKVKK